MKFDFYTDPGHGWVKVKKTLLVKLGIDRKITAYSYQRGEHAYLEEDCDASLLIETLKAKGFSYSFRSHNANKSSKIRSYAPYCA